MATMMKTSEAEPSNVKALLWAGARTASPVLTIWWLRE